MKRLPNLDLVRAIAIISVLGYHISKGLSEQIEYIGELGKYGVHLFFAFSGYLIGNLWFRQYTETGRVNAFYFMANRMARTIPPYYAAFFLYFSIRSQVIDTPFQSKFLFFLQNYSNKIQYYNISWSLCIEEHFYLVFPVFLSLFWKLIPSKIGRFWLLSIITILPTFFRFLYYSEPTYFGYATTATHLNYDFIAYGVLGAYLKQHYSEITVFLSQKLLHIITSTLVLIISFQFIPPQLYYCIGLPLLALTLGSLVTSIATHPTLHVSKFRLVHWVSISSYSIYLTHVIALNASELLVKRLSLPISADIFISIFFSAAIGICFYLTIEKPIINLRHRLIR